MRLLLPAESVLHPVLVVALGVVLAGVSATRLLARSGGVGGLGTTFPIIVSMLLFVSEV